MRSSVKIKLLKSYIYNLGLRKWFGVFFWLFDILVVILIPRSVRLVVRSPPFHGGCTGSNPVPSTK